MFHVSLYVKMKTKIGKLKFGVLWVRLSVSPGRP